ncbi:MAG: ATP-binding protein [Desulfobacterales bacterium]|jgi:AAA+ ATPase superfamily predicted ATPase
MKNPFSFSGIVEDPAFCNREKELSDLIKFIENSQNVLFYSHRRFGKTSLINKVFKDLKGIRAIYVDLYGTTSIEDFITALLKGISSVESKMDKLMKLIKEKVTGLTMNFSIDTYTGAPVAIPVFAPVDKRPALDEVFALLESLSQKKRLAVAFDEFQEISKYGDTAFEKHLRKSIQRHFNISYVFAGSQKHLLTEMFTNSKRAFYKLATSYILKKIKTEDYVAWIQRLYKQDNRQISKKYIENVVARCENHPMYIQEFFFYLWDAPDISIEFTDRVEFKILQNREVEFISIWESLTLNQRKALKLVVAAGGKNIYSADHLSKFGFKSASQVSKALEMLLKRELVSRNRIYAVQDVLFKRWVQKIS